MKKEENNFPRLVLAVEQGGVDSAMLADAARITKQLYDSYVEVGFSKEQALQIVMSIMSGMVTR